MAMDAPIGQGPSSLLGLRPPAELAEGPAPRSVAKDPVSGTVPPRPAYPVISSGWDSEEEEGRGKSSDLMTAVKALAVLSLLIVGIALLIR
jgi:hypothetical protein